MKKRTSTLPTLQPATRAALVGHFQVTFAKSGAIAGAKAGHLKNAQRIFAAYQAANVEPALVELVSAIYTCRDPQLAELRTESMRKLALAAQVAIGIGDDAFPEQLAFAMRFCRDENTPGRMAVFRAWQVLTSKITIGGRKPSVPTKDDLHKLAEDFFGAEIPGRTFDDYIKEMGLDGVAMKPRGRPKKTG